MALFYLNGVFYHPAFRVLGVRYIFIGRLLEARLCEPLSARDVDWLLAGWRKVPLHRWFRSARLLPSVMCGQAGHRHSEHISAFQTPPLGRRSGRGTVFWARSSFSSLRSGRRCGRGTQARCVSRRKCAPVHALCMQSASSFPPGEARVTHLYPCLNMFAGAASAARARLLGEMPSTSDDDPATSAIPLKVVVLVRAQPEPPCLSRPARSTHADVRSRAADVCVA